MSQAQITQNLAELQDEPEIVHADLVPFWESSEDNKPKRGRKPALPRTPEQQAKEHQIKQIEAYLTSASIGQVKEIYLHLKSTELDQKIPGLTPQQKRAVLALQGGF